MASILKKIGEAFTFGKPTADFKGMKIPHISTKDIKLVFHIEVKNPNPIPIPLCDIVYKIVINDREFVKGTSPDAGTLHSHDSKVIDIGVDLVFKDIRDTFTDLQPGSMVNYLLRATFLVDIPVFGRFEIPIDHDGEFPMPAIPDIDVDEIDWVDLSFTETKAVAYVKLENLNKFTMKIKTFEYKLYLTDDLISEGMMDPSMGLAEKEVTRLTVPFTFRPKDMGRAIWDIIRGHESGYTLEGKVTVESPFGPIELPFKKGGATTLKKARSTDEETVKEEAEKSAAAAAADVDQTDYYA
ncbi:hypothetical protein CBR_g75560 [Chara braunii]|uniref:Water stress and hypersensitive response domain-containing protein n=1 Tax=Chara braunii TaxID=69332 RepID=A0A388JJP2_CHABU|nr:hypothetical protein CBR_g75560 [Chara braunii]|eukprot:GBG42162.1 hypothetical protein CBR_g75560 [Chara braunii]